MQLRVTFAHYCTKSEIKRTSNHVPNFYFNCTCSNTLLLIIRVALGHTTHKHTHTHFDSDMLSGHIHVEHRSTP